MLHIHRASKKLCRFYFLNNFLKHSLTLIINMININI